jgi:hypothetical protein
MIAEKLHDSLREVRDSLDKDHAVRLHRSISWLRCAESYTDTDDDIALISAWIAFNACYAVEDNWLNHGEREIFSEFSSRLCALDSEAKIYNLLWDKFSQFVRLLIDNQYVYAPFWSSVRAGDQKWKSKFERSKGRALSGLVRKKPAIILGIVLDRLYVLRNQLIHGGSTYESYVNREQVRDGKRLLMELLPLIITLMMEHKEVDWGRINFPVIES